MPERTVGPTDQPAPASATRVVVHWIPLGAGQHVVRLSGRLFEALSAARQRRPRCALYHSAITIHEADTTTVVEMTPVEAGDPGERGVVCGGAVGLAWLGRFRLFRYEVRCWADGVIPDLDAAVATITVSDDPALARRLVALAPTVPTPVWGRDELGAGEMWNSNSISSWLLARSGVDVSCCGPPTGGRAPGWDAGVFVARSPHT